MGQGISDKQMQAIEHFSTLQRIGVLSMEQVANLTDRTLLETQGDLQSLTKADVSTEEIADPRAQRKAALASYWSYRTQTSKPVRPALAIFGWIVLVAGLTIAIFASAALLV